MARCVVNGADGSGEVADMFRWGGEVLREEMRLFFFLGLQWREHMGENTHGIGRSRATDGVDTWEYGTKNQWYSNIVYTTKLRR
jgi:hypothetical protein